MASLFLLGSTWDESPALVRAVLKRGAGKDATILALDFWAGRKLREASIAYQTPREYLEIDHFRDLDALATRFAHTWYEVPGDRLAHNGISLGELAEYGFTFLFIDALRSVEIARRVFDRQEPDRLFLSPRSLPRPLPNPNSICHESLPSVARHLAHDRNIPVNGSEHPPPLGREGESRDGVRGSRRLQGLGGRLLESARRGFERSRALFHAFASRRRPSVLFMDVSSHARIGEAIRGRGLQAVNLTPTRAGWMKAKLRTSALQEIWEDLREDPDFRQALTYKEVPLSEVLAHRFREFFHRQAPALIEYIEGAESLIRQLKPQMLVVPEDLSPIRRATCRVFRQHGLPVLVVLEGAVSVDVGGFHVMPREAQRIAVWGDLIRDWHIKRGKPAGSQVVTGNPGFDLIASGHHPDEREVRRRLRLREAGGIILVATEWFTGVSSGATIEDEERFFRHTLRALVQFPGFEVVVKLHPNYQATYERIVRTIAVEEGVDVVIAKEHLWDLLAVSDVVIVSNSTVGIEAMILGKPVVLVHTYEGVEEIPYVSSGAALGARRVEEIVSAVAASLSPEGEGRTAEARSFVHDFASLQDGRAFERVARVVGGMIQDDTPSAPADS